MKKIIFSIIGAGMLMALTNSCEHEKPKNTYCFEKEVLPVIVSNCATPGCHSSLDSAGGYILDGYNYIVKKGVAPGNASASLLYTSLSSSAAHTMPQDPYPLLDDNSKAIIKIWIDEGAFNLSGCTAACNESSFKYSTDVLPLIKTNCNGCHNTAAYQDFGGGIELSDYATIKDLAFNGELTKSMEHDPAVFSGMSKGLSKLTDCQINIVKKWVAAGAPNN